MKVKACNIVNDNDYRCNRSFQVHEFYLRDPNNDSNSEFVYVCRFDYDRLIKEINEENTKLSRNLENLKYEMNRERAACKEYEIPFRNESLMMKIDNLKILIKRMSSGECKNPFCRADLTKLPQGQKIYTATSFKPSGRRHYTFNYCSEKCFKNIKGKLGIFDLSYSKQTILNP